MGGAAVAMLAAAATRHNRAPLASLLYRVSCGLHDASAAAAAGEEDKSGTPSRRRRRRSSSSLLLGPDFLDTWDPSPRAASRTQPLPDAGADYGCNATIIDGKSIAEDIRLHIAEEVRQMKSAVGHVPGLAVVLVGDRRDSESYVRYKTKGCEEVGIKSLLAKLPGNCTEDEVMDSVSRFNEDPSVHGILVQLPLPQRHHATVSVIHAFTTDPEAITRESDIVISAAGVANLVRGSWLKQGAVVIDVGTNPIEDPTSDYGYRLTGDVCFEEAVKVASAITPVPGGVGPVTIAMLLGNTLDSAKQVYGLHD
nr:unnamed protein product [Digitaria exilis]